MGSLSVKVGTGLTRLCLLSGLLSVTLGGAALGQAASGSREAIPAGCHYRFGYCVAEEYQSVFNVDGPIAPRPTADLQAVLRLGAQVTLTALDQVIPAPLTGFSEWTTKDGVLFFKRSCQKARERESLDSCAYLTTFVAQADLAATRERGASPVNNITLWASSPAAMKAIQAAIAVIAGDQMTPLSDLGPAD